MKTLIEKTLKKRQFSLCVYEGDQRDGPLIKLVLVQRKKKPTEQLNEGMSNNSMKLYYNSQATPALLTRISLRHINLIQNLSPTHLTAKSNTNMLYSFHDT